MNLHDIFFIRNNANSVLGEHKLDHFIVSLWAKASVCVCCRCCQWNFRISLFIELCGRSRWWCRCIVIRAEVFVGVFTHLFAATTIWMDLHSRSRSVESQCSSVRWRCTAKNFLQRICTSDVVYSERWLKGRGRGWEISLVHALVILQLIALVFLVLDLHVTLVKSRCLAFGRYRRQQYRAHRRVVRRWQDVITARKNIPRVQTWGGKEGERNIWRCTLKRRETIKGEICYISGPKWKVKILEFQTFLSLDFFKNKIARSIFLLTSQS